SASFCERPSSLMSLVTSMAPYILEISSPITSISSSFSDGTSVSDSSVSAASSTKSSSFSSINPTRCLIMGNFIDQISKSVHFVGLDLVDQLPVFKRGKRGQIADVSQFP